MVEIAVKSVFGVKQASVVVLSVLLSVVAVHSQKNILMSQLVNHSIVRD